MAMRMGFITRFSKKADRFLPRHLTVGGLIALVATMVACSGQRESAIEFSRLVAIDTADGPRLEVDQRMTLSPAMVDAISHGVALVFDYRLRDCHGRVSHARVEVMQRQVDRRFLLTDPEGRVREFASLSGLIAATDRLRLPIPTMPEADCHGTLRAALDLTSLPLPLRFPAFFRPTAWRLVTAEQPWRGR